MVIWSASHCGLPLVRIRCLKADYKLRWCVWVVWADLHTSTQGRRDVLQWDGWDRWDHRRSTDLVSPHDFCFTWSNITLLVCSTTAYYVNTAIFSESYVVIPDHYGVDAVPWQWLSSMTGCSHSRTSSDWYGAGEWRAQKSFFLQTDTSIWFTLLHK